MDFPTLEAEMRPFINCEFRLVLWTGVTYIKTLNEGRKAEKEDGKAEKTRLKLWNAASVLSHKILWQLKVLENHNHIS